MKYLLTILFFLCLATKASTQNIDFYGKEVAKEICNQYGMKDDKEAKDCLDKICDAADIPNNFVLAPCTDIGNCFALYKNGYSYIVYDINFFSKVKTYGFTEKNLPKNTIDWPALTVLAHELGHHMCRHTTDPNLASLYSPVQIELQADEYAGTVMYKLGATLEQAQRVMNSSDVPAEASLTHPARKDRLLAIAKGWLKENKKYNDKTTTTNSLELKPLPKQPTAGDLPNMVLVEGGSFNMGSNNGSDDEKPVHVVSVNSFYICKFEVTVAEYRAFCSAANHAMPEAPEWTWNDNDPIVNVNYDDAMAYCAWQSKQLNRICRLPTEAEWEYAARGGNSAKGYAYSGSNNIDDVAWFGANAGHKPHPVGQREPNELGIFNMAGNVWEWCSDWYNSKYYSNSPSQNPQGESDGAGRVVRGGGWSDSPQFCRSSARLGANPGLIAGNVGFRMVIQNTAN